VTEKITSLRRTQILPLQVDFSNEENLGQIRNILDTLNDGQNPTIFGLLEIHWQILMMIVSC